LLHHKKKQAHVACFFYFCASQAIFLKNIIIMGRGDKKTKRGKISSGSFGKSRPAREIIRKAAAESKGKKAGE
jgi:30S ribosomal protein S31